MACLLTETAGSSPHVARWVFSMMFHDKILLYIIKLYIYDFDLYLVENISHSYSYLLHMLGAPKVFPKY